MLLSLLASMVPASSAGPERTSRYIVVLRDSVDHPGAVAQEHSRDHGAQVSFVYRHALKGYAASMSDAAAARLASDERVTSVELDGEAHKVDTQTGATWGLDRIDQHLRPLDALYNYSATGAGVTAYIIDTGIRATLHAAEFGTRVVSGTDTVNPGTDSDDCDGHGTHVAGTVGSSTYGVAKGVTLVGVRVLDCNGSGSWSGVIAGIDWVTGNHTAGSPAVANMSLGGGASSSVDAAVTGSIADGVTYAVAAGNGNMAGKAVDACGYSPARVPNALTVGATNSSDTKASWSNYGTCLDLFAPGVSITSTTMDGLTATWSGTSMATPHVAGVAALYLQANPGHDPASVSNAITTAATAGVVGSPGSGSPNRLLYSLFTPAAPPPTTDPVAPVAAADSAETTTGGTVKVSVLANDTDANNQALTITALTDPVDPTDSTAPGGSTVLSDADTSVTYSAPATAGTYTFTYRAYDGGLTSEPATVTVTVTDPPPPPAGATTATVSYTAYGGKTADRHLLVRVVLTAANGSVVPNTSIEANISNNGLLWIGTGTTLSDGSATWEIKNAPSGSYSTVVAKVAGAVWTGTTTDPGFTK